MRAYSYARVSSGRQTTGSGLARQTDLAERWAERHGLQLDSSLQLSDAGKSAYKGKHLGGALGRFLQLAQAGEIEPGSILLVEAIDRLSRLEPIDGLQDVIFALVRAGIRLVTLEDGQEYSRELFSEDQSKLLFLVVKISESFKYSQRLSTRVGAAHLKREADLQAGKPRSTGSLPFWITRTPEGPLVLNEGAEIVREIYRLSEQGKGGHQIARSLNEAGQLTSKGMTWSAMNVNRLFSKPSVCGDLVFRGKTYPSFYPPAVTREQYEAATHRRAQNPGRRGGFASADQMHWIGQGITFCAECGSAIGFNSCTNRDGSRGRYLRCRRGQTGACSSKGWKLDAATEYLLARLTRRALEVVLRTKADTSGLEAAVKAAEVQVEAARRRLHAAESKAVEAAQDPEVDLSLLKILSSAAQQAEEAVRAGEREYLAAQASYQGARGKVELVDLPRPDLSTTEGRRTLNEGLHRLGLQISADWRGQRWGLALPGTVVVWSTFSPDSWLEFDWVGPPNEPDADVEAWHQQVMENLAN